METYFQGVCKTFKINIPGVQRNEQIYSLFQNNRYDLISHSCQHNIRALLYKYFGYLFGRSTHDRVFERP